MQEPTRQLSMLVPIVKKKRESEGLTLLTILFVALTAMITIRAVIIPAASALAHLTGVRLPDRLAQ